MLSRRQWLRAAAGGSLPWSAAANALDAPKGAVLLTVSGAIKHGNAEQTARLDLTQLDAIDFSGFTTRTPWHNDKTKFEGVGGAALMKFLGATGSTVYVTATNKKVPAPKANKVSKNKVKADAAKKPAAKK